MRHQIDEAADCLRMYLDIPSSRTSANGTARPADRFPEGSHHVLPKLLDPVTGKGAFLGRDSVSLQSGDLFGNVQLNWFCDCHWWLVLPVMNLKCILPLTVGVPHRVRPMHAAEQPLPVETALAIPIATRN